MFGGKISQSSTSACDVIFFFVCWSSSKSSCVPSIEMAMDESTAKSISTVPNLVVISSPIQQITLFRLTKPIPVPTKTVSELQHSADRFLCFLRSQTSLLKKFLSSSSSSFQTFCNQMRSRTCCQVRFPLSTHNFAAILPGDSVAGIVVTNGILNFLNIYNTLLILRLVLTWFPNTPPAIVSPLSTLCDPYLNIFRGLIPPLGGTLDLSPILAFLVLNAFTSTAAALPCELPPAGSTRLSEPTSLQTKWLRRLHANRTKCSSTGAN